MMNQSDQSVVSDSGADWVEDFFRDADKVDVAKLVAWFDDDIDLRFANNPRVSDKKTATEVMTAFYSSIAGMHHAREAIVCDGDTASQQAIVTYTTSDDYVVAIPVASYLRRNEQGLLDRLWIYIDIAPLYAPRSDAAGAA